MSKQRFLFHVYQDPKTGCWQWTGATRSRTQPYGAFWYKGKMCYAHRVAWEMYKGEVPAGMLICHSCDNTACVNPDHMFLGTASDNNKDSMKKGRHLYSLDSEKASEIRSLYATGKYSQRDLAAKYDTAQSNIQRILSEQIWTG